MTIENETPAPAAEEPKATPEPTLDAEAGATADQVAMGIAYSESFTLEDAVNSFNATREDIKKDGKVILSAQQQRLKPRAAWIKKHGGTFTLRRASIYDEIQQRVRFAQLSGNQPLDAMTSQVVEGTVIAELLLTESPKWFSLESLTDTTIPLLILHWYSYWSNSFREED